MTQNGEAGGKPTPTPPERRVLAVDIETVGLDWDALDQHSRDYLLGRAPDEAAREAVPKRMSLSPATGRIIVIGVWDPDRENGAVLYEGEKTAGWLDNDDESAPRRLRGDERTLLTEFWKMARGYRRIVTFNGRGFDGPFLMIRSALLGVTPTRQLVGNRYHPDNCDLAEVLSFYGAWRERYNLDFWCRRFGIKSPKSGGIDGAKVGEVYAAGGIDRIADYCLEDARATALLYKALEPTLLRAMQPGR